MLLWCIYFTNKDRYIIIRKTSIPTLHQEMEKGEYNCFYVKNVQSAKYNEINQLCGWCNSVWQKLRRANKWGRSCSCWRGILQCVLLIPPLRVRSSAAVIPLHSGSIDRSLQAPIRAFTLWIGKTHALHRHARWQALLWFHWGQEIVLTLLRHGRSRRD